MLNREILNKLKKLNKNEKLTEQKVSTKDIKPRMIMQNLKRHEVVEML